MVSRQSIDNCFQVIEKQIYNLNSKVSLETIEEEEAAKKAEEIIRNMKQQCSLNNSRISQGKNSLFKWVQKLKTSTKVSPQKLYMMLFKNLFGRTLQNPPRNTIRATMLASTRKSINNLVSSSRTFGMSLFNSKFRQSGLMKGYSKLITVSTIKNCIAIFFKNSVISISSISLKRIKNLLNNQKIYFSYGPLSVSLYNLKLNNFSKVIERKNVMKDYDKEFIDEGLDFKSVDKMDFKVNLLPRKLDKVIVPPYRQALNIMGNTEEPELKNDVFISDKFEEFDYIPCLMKIDIKTNNNFNFDKIYNAIPTLLDIEK